MLEYVQTAHQLSEFLLIVNFRSVKQKKFIVKLIREMLKSAQWNIGQSVDGMILKESNVPNIHVQAPIQILAAHVAIPMYFIGQKENVLSKFRWSKYIIRERELNIS